MPRINVLEVRHAPTKEGPWGEWQALPREPDFISHENCVPHETIDDWDENHHMTYVWREFRVVPYERVELPEAPP
jgi:hypothetical protein